MQIQQKQFRNFSTKCHRQNATTLQGALPESAVWQSRISELVALLAVSAPLLRSLEYRIPGGVFPETLRRRCLRSSGS